MQQATPNHIMIDLETMGTDDNAPILAIGACEFNPATASIGSSIYLLASLESNLALGRIPSASTIYWWLKQNQAAQGEIVKTEKATPLTDALKNLKKWIHTRCENTNTYPVVWGNSAAFDIGKLNSAYRLLGVAPPWEFWDEQCYRTLKTVHNHIPFNRQGTHHNALHDAESQALHAAQILHQYQLTIQKNK